MSDTATRQDTVEQNIADVIARWGDEATMKIISQCVQDISISLAMLVDTPSSSSDES